MGLLDFLTERLQSALERPQAARSWRCRCGAPIFFDNSACLSCGAELGFVPERLSLEALPGPTTDGRAALSTAAGEARQRCANRAAVGCNWMLPAHEAGPHGGLCRACRLNRTLPDLSLDENRTAWRAIEAAKRRLVMQLLALGLPVKSRLTEDPAHGLMFDFLRPLPDAPVHTGHASGLITLNVEEADDARREQISSRCTSPTARCWATSAMKSATTTGTAWCEARPGCSRSARVSATNAKTMRPRCNGTTTRVRRPTGRSAASRPTPARTRGKTGPRPSRITCTWSTPSRRR